MTVKRVANIEFAVAICVKLGKLVSYFLRDNSSIFENALSLMKNLRVKINISKYCETHHYYRIIINKHQVFCRVFLCRLFRANKKDKPSGRLFIQEIHIENITDFLWDNRIQHKNTRGHVCLLSNIFF